MRMPMLPKDNQVTSADEDTKDREKPVVRLNMNRRHSFSRSRSPSPERRRRRESWTRDDRHYSPSPSPERRGRYVSRSWSRERSLSPPRSPRSSERRGRSRSESFSPRRSRSPPYRPRRSPSSYRPAYQSISHSSIRGRGGMWDSYRPIYARRSASPRARSSPLAKPRQDIRPKEGTVKELTLGERLDDTERKARNGKLESIVKRIRESRPQKPLKRFYGSDDDDDETSPAAGGEAL